MDFTLSEAASDAAGLAETILTTVLSVERTGQLESDDAPIDERLWAELTAAGLLSLETDNGLSILESMAVAERLGGSLARVPFGDHAITALPLIHKHGSTILREELADRLSGSDAVLVVAGEEDDPHSNPTTPQTTLTPTADGWSLVGTKINVGYAGHAAAILVTAMTDDGVVVVMVDPQAPGVTLIPTPSTGRTPRYALELSGVHCNRESVLAGGARTAAELTVRQTLAICADQLGTLSQALQLTSTYASEREQFSRPIGSFQAVAQRLADGYIDLQGLSLTTTQAGWLFTQQTESIDAGELELAVATAKFWAAEAGHRIAHTTVHVHGGVGLDTSHPAHRYFLRAKQNEFTLGAAPLTLETIGAVIAGTPA